jgi:hypothetical protein
MFRAVLTCCLIPATASLALAQPRPQPPHKLLLSANRPPTPALRLALLPELRDQEPGDAWPLYQQAAKLLKKLPAFQELPRDQAARVLEIYREPLALLEKASRCEACNSDIPERLRKAGFNAVLPGIQELRQALPILVFKVRQELLQDQPEQALRTLRVAYRMGQRVGEASTLISYLVGVALTTQANDALPEVLSHPRTPNLYWSLTTLPQPFLSLRKGLEGERLAAYGTFPALVAVARDLDAGPVPGEQLRQIVRDVLAFQERPDNFAIHLVLAQQVRNQHDEAKNALVAMGRPRARVDSWPQLQVALMYGLLDYERHLDELTKWESQPYYQAAQGLEEEVRKARALGTLPLPLGQPAFPLAGTFIPALHRVAQAGARLERQFAALRCVEAIRLYAAAHGGRLPATLAAIKEVPLPICPVTGKPFAYRLEGESAFLSAPGVPGDIRAAIRPLAYEIMIRR